MNSRRVLIVMAWVLAAVAALVVPAAAAQVDPSAQTGVLGEVDLQILQFGAGKVCRAGELVGVQVEVQDRLTRPRGLLVRLVVTDPDGDLTLAQIAVASTGGQKQRAWIYTRVPFAVSASPVFTLEAFEDVVGSDGAQTGRTGKLVGKYSYRLQGQELAPAHTGLMAVVGRQLLNLDLYRVRTTSGLNCAPFGHEVIHDIAQLRPGSRGNPGELPDRWYGLAQFEAVVWVASGAEGEPTDLTPGQAEAIREWVERGGHLVVVLPPAGQNWIGSTDNPLVSILPRATARRLEGVDLEPLRPLLLGDPRRTAGRKLPTEQSLHVFVPDPRAEAGEAVRVLTMPTAECIAIRRLVGTGMVTVLGVDLTSRQMLQTGGVATDVFWHRVLGKRGVLVNPSQLQATTNSFGAAIDNRGMRAYDAGIRDEIAKTAAATVGLLLAFIVFAGYWILAGPLGFAALRRKNWIHHAWVAFVVVGAGFTALAWGGATFLRPMTISATHVTFLDHVYGQNTQRSKSFVSVLLPRYGSMRVSVADADATGRFRNGLFAWDPPREREVAPESYPDARGYEQDGRHPAWAEFPARYTTKNIQVDWAGGPRWKMISPMTGDAAGRLVPGGRIDLMDPSPTQGLLRGVLVHEMPLPLENVVIVVVEGQNLGLDTTSGFSTRTGVPLQPGRPPARVNVFQLTQPWPPGQALDLEPITGVSVQSSGENYLRALVPAVSQWEQNQGDSGQVVNTAAIPQHLTALSFFSMFEPPNFAASPGGFGGPDVPLARRRATHAVDLSRWFTQPCVIVVGHLGDRQAEDTCPYPLWVDVAEDERATAAPLRRITGRTIVRWVYPLRDLPTVYPRPEEAATTPPP